MERKYVAFGERLRARMDAVGIRTNREFAVRLALAHCKVGENMISRWMVGRGRPQGPNLEAVLDVLGIMDADERTSWSLQAHIPPPRQTGGNRLSEDDVPTLIDPPSAA